LNGSPALITFIDVGQALFVFIMGFAGYTAFTSRLYKRGPGSAVGYVARRVLLLYALAALDSILLNSLKRGGPDWAAFFYGSTFSGIALGALAAFVATALCPNADRRIFIAGILLLVHALLFEFPLFDRYTWFDDVWGFPKFPFMAAGQCVIGIAGSCFGQWHATNPAEPEVLFRSRILPVSMFAFICAYSMEWLQPSEHHDLPAALQLQAIYVGGFMLMIFFAFGRVGFRFPLLSSFGKNLLLMFVLGGFGVSVYWNFLPRDLLLTNPLATLALVAIAPIAVLGCFAVLLDKRGILVRA
jgi:hypothetical protein